VRPAENLVTETGPKALIQRRGVTRWHVPPDPTEFDPEQLDSSTKESIRKVRLLVDDLRSIEEHEKAIVDDDPPLFRRP
jgi:hypothetical protein